MVSILAAACARPQRLEPISDWILPTALSAVPLPSAATAEPGPVPTAICTNEALFVEDLTIPDGTVVAPGQRIDKRWSIRNTGSCNWGPAYRLAPLGESSFTLPGDIALFPARAGEEAVVQVILEAPDRPGEYASRWQPMAPDGSLFGDPIFMLIYVEPATPTPEPTSIPTAAPSA
jgi:hypothetical protein